MVSWATVQRPSVRYSAANSASQNHTHSLEVIASHEPERVHSWYEPTKLDIFFLGITIVMCGQYMSWNIGLVAGVYTYLILYVIMGLAYIAFCCCMAELTSALPFAGGSYGLARCTLGFFPAFLIGCAESLECTASTAIQAICVCDILSSAAPSLTSYKPLVWLVVFFIPTTTAQCIGGASFWLVSTVLGVFQMVLLLVYCFGLLGDVSFTANALKDSEMLFAGGVNKAMYVFPYSAWFFLGIEALNLASNDVAKPKTQIPHGQVPCMCALFITGLWMYLVEEVSLIQQLLPMAGEGGLAVHRWSDNGLLQCDYDRHHGTLDAVFQLQRKMYGDFFMAALLATPACGAGFLLSTTGDVLRRTDMPGLLSSKYTIGDVLNVKWIGTNRVAFECKVSEYPLLTHMANQLKCFCDLLVFQYRA